MLVSLPIVLILMDIWPLGRIDFTKETLRKKLPGLIREKAALFVLSGLSCGITFIAQRAGGAVGSLHAYPIDVRVLNAVVTPWATL